MLNPGQKPLHELVWRRWHHRRHTQRSARCACCQAGTATMFLAYFAKYKYVSTFLATVITFLYNSVTFLVTPVLPVARLSLPVPLRCYKERTSCCMIVYGCVSLLLPVLLHSQCAPGATALAELLLHDHMQQHVSHCLCVHAEQMVRLPEAFFCYCCLVACRPRPSLLYRSKAGEDPTGEGARFAGPPHMP